MSYYTYSQNNSGGSFTGPAHYVIVEADSPEQADERAEGLGLYFGGAGDCPCCGDRWFAASEYDEAEVPTAYNSTRTHPKTPRKRPQNGL